VKKNRERKLKDKEKKGPSVVGIVPGAKVAAQNLTDRRNLHNYRVVQRNLIYVVGIPGTMATEELLRKPEYFGQYGKIGKIVIHRNQSAAQTSVSAYITFVHKEDAKAAIQSLDGFWSDGHLVRASFGTTKYCNNFIRGVNCSNPDCVYLHDLGDDDDRFTKEEIQAGQSKLVPTPGQNQALITGNGGPSGTGKRPTGEPLFPPPVFIQDVGSTTAAGTRNPTTSQSNGGATPAKEKALTWASSTADLALSSQLFDVADDGLSTEISFSESNDNLSILSKVANIGGGSVTNINILSPTRSSTTNNQVVMDKINGRAINNSLVSTIGGDSMTTLLKTSDVSLTATSKLLAVLNSGKDNNSSSTTTAGGGVFNGVSNIGMSQSAVIAPIVPRVNPASAMVPVSMPNKVESASTPTVSSAYNPSAADHAAMLTSLHMNISMNRLDPLKEPQLFAAFNGVTRSMVFPVPVSAYTCTVWSTILSKCSTDLRVDPFSRTSFPVSEFLDLTLPPVDAVCAPPWPKPNAYYRRGLEAGILLGGGVLAAQQQSLSLPPLLAVNDMYHSRPINR